MPVASYYTDMLAHYSHMLYVSIHIFVLSAIAIIHVVV